MVSDETLLEALRAVIDIDESPVATPDDVAASLPVGGETVRQRLLRIAADDDEIRTRKAGTARLFWIPSTLHESAAPPAPAERIIGADHGPDRDDLRERLTEQAEARIFDDDDDRVDELVATVDVPGWDDDVVDDRRAALAMTLRLLEERGPMRRREILGEVYPEHSGDYGSRESLWTNWLQGALSELADEDHLRRATGTHDDPGWDLQAE